MSELHLMCYIKYSKCYGVLTESDCVGSDMSNISSMYLGIIGGAIIGAIISWWIYNRQKKISEKQDGLLTHIEGLEEKHKKF